MSEWDGYPQDRERDGWHWVCSKPVPWLAEWQLWSMPAAYISPDMMAERASVMGAYEGPLITPAQHAAEVEQARREGATDELPSVAQREAGTAWMRENWRIAEEDPAFVAAALYRIMIRARGGFDAP